MDMINKLFTAIERMDRLEASAGMGGSRQTPTEEQPAAERENEVVLRPDVNEVVVRYTDNATGEVITRTLASRGGFYVAPDGSVDWQHTMRECSVYIGDGEKWMLWHDALEVICDKVSNVEAVTPQRAKADGQAAAVEVQTQHTLLNNEEQPAPSVQPRLSPFKFGRKMKNSAKVVSDVLGIAKAYVIHKALKLEGNPCYCVKQLYALAEMYPEELRAILPPKKIALSEHVKAICDFGKVGSKKTWSGTVKGCPTVKEYTVKCSVDMCLRYFVKLANKNLDITNEVHERVRRNAEQVLRNKAKTKVRNVQVQLAAETLQPSQDAPPPEQHGLQERRARVPQQDAPVATSTITVRFKFDRETKNTFRFAEVGTDVPGIAKIYPIYVDKSVLRELGYKTGSTLQVTLSVAK